VFALGLVLYEAATGVPAAKYPEPPHAMLERADRDQLLELSEVLHKACHFQPKRRLSAARLEIELERLLKRWNRAEARADKPRKT
jgi:hypothetical protein